MITLMILLVICGLLLTVVGGVAAFLLDPIIAVVLVYLLYKGIRALADKKS